METRLKYLLKNIGLLTISNFASKILVFLLVPIYTSILTTEEYGIYDLVVTTVAFVFPVFTANVCDAVLRFSLDKKYDKSQISSIGLLFVVINIIMFTIGLFIFIKINAGILKEISTAICLYYSAYSLYQYLSQLAQGHEKVFELSVAGVICTISMISFNLFFLLILKIGLKGFFYANTLAFAISGIYLIFNLNVIRLISFKINKKLQIEMLTYSIPLMASVIGWLVNNTSDRYVVAGMCGISASGLLSVSYKIPQIIGTLQNIFLQAWQISAIREYSQKDSNSFYRNSFYFVNVIMCIACSALIILTKPLAYVLYSKDFFAAWIYVPFLLISCVFNNASGMLGSILAAQKNTKILSLSTIWGAIANLFLNILLIRMVGVQGATIATALSSYLIYLIRYNRVNNLINTDYHCTLCWLLLIIQAILLVNNEKMLFQILIIILIISINLKETKNILSELIVKKTT